MSNGPPVPALHFTLLLSHCTKRMLLAPTRNCSRVLSAEVLKPRPKLPSVRVSSLRGKRSSHPPSFKPWLTALPAATSTTAVLSTSPPLAFSSFSCGSIPPSAGPSQTIDPTRNTSLPHTGQSQSSLHSLPLVAPMTHNGDQLEVEGGFGEDPLTSIWHPQGMPKYDYLFFQWLHARRAWMISQGCLDPWLVDPPLDVVFGAWLRKFWPLFHFLGLGTPETNRSGWVGTFDFWFIDAGYIMSPLSSHTTPANPGAILTIPYHTPAMTIASPASATSASGVPHYRNEESTLTVEKIQHNSTTAGGEKDAVNRLALVFPPGSVVTREALKVVGKPRGGPRGYYEFTEQRHGLWQCLLCCARSYINKKDLLDHVWNTHCDPPTG